ncbi:hypothetical protein ABW20_dc0108490 [Dactylellina cionopaga]|nr:hypothetical protein ABW20_dc0108490 [Dactylellina cionopaga]
MKVITKNALPLGGSSSELALRKGEKLDASIKILRNMYELQTGPLIKNWIWFFSDFVQWHTMTFTLSEFCQQPKGKLADETWSVLEPILDLWDTGSNNRRDSELLEPVTRLIVQARRKRAEDIKTKDPTTRTNLVPQNLPELDLCTPQDPDSGVESTRLEDGNSPTYEPNGFSGPLGDMPRAFDKVTVVPANFGVDFGFEESLVAFDWESWATEAQNMGFDFGFI